MFTLYLCSIFIGQLFQDYIAYVDISVKRSIHVIS